MSQEKSQIRYDVLIQRALRQVVREVLTRVMQEGLPGGHYFHITFRTGAPGVRLSSSLRERFPHYMTVVLQHQFWCLKVTERELEVGLYFGGIPERLYIPFDAISDFRDESVQLHLTFPPLEAVEDSATAPSESPTGGLNLENPLDKKFSGEVGVERKNSENGLPAQEKISSSDNFSQEAVEQSAGTIPPKVVSIEAFRRKT